MQCVRACVTETIAAIGLFVVAGAPVLADCSPGTVVDDQRKLGVGIESANYQQIETYGQIAANQFAQCTPGLSRSSQLDSQLAEARVLVITARAYLRDRAASGSGKAAPMLRNAVREAKQVEASSSASDSQRAQAAEVVADAARFQ